MSRRGSIQFSPVSQLSSRSCHCAHFTELRCPSAFETGAVVGQDSRAVYLDLRVYRGGAAVTAPTVILQSHVGNVYPVGTTAVNAVGTVCLDDGPDGCVEVGCSFDVTVLDACTDVDCGAGGECTGAPTCVMGTCVVDSADIFTDGSSCGDGNGACVAGECTYPCDGFVCPDAPNACFDRGFCMLGTDGMTPTCTAPSQRSDGHRSGARCESGVDHFAGRNKYYPVRPMRPLRSAPRQPTDAELNGAGQDEEDEGVQGPTNFQVDRTPVTTIPATTAEPSPSPTVANTSQPSPAPTTATASVTTATTVTTTTTTPEPETRDPALPILAEQMCPGVPSADVVPTDFVFLLDGSGSANGAWFDSMTQFIAEVRLPVSPK